jgi:N-acetylglucosamine-6-phosphate deacetylase
MPSAAPDGAEPLGFNLEGPFISPRRKGAQNPAHIVSPDGVPFEILLPGVSLQ